jgi:hypothetical protein
VSTSSFTLTTSAGQKATIDEAPSTTYEKGTSPASVSAVTRPRTRDDQQYDHHGHAGHRAAG